MKQNLLYYLCPIMTMLLMPQLMQRYSTLVTLFLIVVLLYLGVIKRKGYTMEFLAIILCLPYVPSLDNSISLRQFNYLNVLLPYIMFIIFFVQRDGLNKIIIFKQWRNFSLFYLLLTLTYSIILYDSFNIRTTNEITYVLSTVIFFGIALVDKLENKHMGRIFDILFYFTCAYVLLQSFFQWTPYDWYYDRQIITVSNDYIRARGLLGNSLSLTCFITLYEAYTVIRSPRLNGIASAKLFLCVVIGLLSLSRTFLVLSIAIIPLWFIISGKIRSFKFISILSILSVVIFILLSFFMSDYIDILQMRIDEDGAGHRFSSFSTVLNLFSVHLFGAGSDCYEVIAKEHLYVGDYIVDFGTFDNYFLTQIAYYGLLAIIVFIYDYYLLLKVYRYSGFKSALFTQVLFLFIYRSAIGFSFDIQFFGIFNATFFFILSVLFRDYFRSHNQVQHETLS